MEILILKEILILIGILILMAILIVIAIIIVIEIIILIEYCTYAHSNSNSERNYAVVVKETVLDIFLLFESEIKIKDFLKSAFCHQF